MAARLGAWWQARRTAGALQQLDDAALKDIGVCRCEIDWFAHATAAGGVAGDPTPVLLHRVMVMRPAIGPV
jgi:hypothetical protein